MISVILRGNIRKSGTAVLENDITWRQLIWDIGGGIPGKREFKLARINDAVFAADQLDEPVPLYEGAEILIVDENSCPLALALAWLSEENDDHERLRDIMLGIQSGAGTDADLEELAAVLESDRQGGAAYCCLRQLWQIFRQEFCRHVSDRLCPGGICPSLTRYHIGDNCRGCMMCFNNCPTGAIFGEPLHRYTIDQDKCTGCGKCLRSCKFRAVNKRWV